MSVLASFTAASGSTASLIFNSPFEAPFDARRRFVVRFEGAGWWAEEEFREERDARDRFEEAVTYQRDRDAQGEGR